MAEHVIIVGVGAGLGSALARRSAREGSRTTLVARRPDVVEELAANLAAAGADVEAVVVDAAYEPAFTAALERVVTERGAPTLVVYNAVDPTPSGKPSELDPEALTMALETNVTGALVTVLATLEPMRAAGGGSIIMTGGILGSRPAAAMTSLSIGKAALRAYALCLHQELAADDPVNAITMTITGVIKPGSPFDPNDIADRMFEAHRDRETGRGGEILYRGSGGD